MKKLRYTNIIKFFRENTRELAFHCIEKKDHRELSPFPTTPSVPYLSVADLVRICTTSTALDMERRE
jgi:hypothetical protein